VATPRRPARKSDSRYFLRFAATATLLVAGTLVLVLFVLPRRYVLSSGFREGNLALPNPSIPFEPADPLVIAALPPLPPSTEVVRGPSELFWERVLPLLEQERFDEAIPVFASYLANYPGDLDVRREYGITLARGGYGERAIPVLESLLPVQGDRQLRLLLARTLRDIGNAAGAATLYAAILRSTPDDEEIVLEWARAHMGVEEYAQAESVLQSALEVIQGSVPIRIELARIYYYTNRLEDAEAILLSMSDEELASVDALQLREDVVAALTPPPEPEVEPPPPPTLLEQAVGAREDGDFTRASELYEAALADDPTDADAWQAYADFLQYVLEDFEGALRALAEVERLYGGGGVELQYRMAQLEVWTDQSEVARTRLQALLVLMEEEDAARRAGALPARADDPDAVIVTQADVMALLGDLDRWDGLRLPAVRSYEAALALDPTHERALEGLRFCRPTSTARWSRLRNHGSESLPSLLRIPTTSDGWIWAVSGTAYPGTGSGGREAEPACSRASTPAVAWMRRGAFSPTSRVRAGGGGARFGRRCTSGCRTSVTRSSMFPLGFRVDSPARPDEERISGSTTGPRSARRTPSRPSKSMSVRIGCSWRTHGQSTSCGASPQRAKWLR